MPYRGHVEKGVVVFDEPVDVTEGTEVRVELLVRREEKPNSTPLRGTPYRYDEPFAPAVDESPPGPTCG